MQSTFTFLGTGTSTGVPQIGCPCSVCTSSDPRDNRLRASGILSVDAPTGRRVNLLIDCGPDFRTQMLRAGAPSLDAMLITHSHYDHVGGIDDMRPYCASKPFTTYCRTDVAVDLRQRIPYCFASHLYPGVPTFNIHEIGDRAFDVCGIEVTPLPVMHYRLPIIGFKIGDFAYITDCKTMPDATIDLLRGVDTLVLNALRLQPHMSHLSLSEALAIIERLQPRRAWLTHISHDMGRHADIDPQLPAGVRLAYDGLTVTIPE